MDGTPFRSKVHALVFRVLCLSNDRFDCQWLRNHELHFRHLRPLCNGRADMNLLVFALHNSPRRKISNNDTKPFVESYNNATRFVYIFVVSNDSRAKYVLVCYCWFVELRMCIYVRNAPR